MFRAWCWGVGHSENKTRSNSPDHTEDDAIELALRAAPLPSPVHQTCNKESRTMAAPSWNSDIKENRVTFSLQNHLFWQLHRQSLVRALK